jgi:hypothetical protein
MKRQAESTRACRGSESVAVRSRPVLPCAGARLARAPCFGDESRGTDSRASVERGDRPAAARSPRARCRSRALQGSTRRTWFASAFASARAARMFAGPPRSVDDAASDADGPPVGQPGSRRSRRSVRSDAPGTPASRGRRGELRGPQPLHRLHAFPTGTYLPSSRNPHQILTRSRGRMSRINHQVAGRGIIHRLPGQTDTRGIPAFQRRTQCRSCDALLFC